MGLRHSERAPDIPDGAALAHSGSRAIACALEPRASADPTPSMIDVRFKHHAGPDGPGHWTHARLPEFLSLLPYLFLPGEGEKPVPPLPVINEVLDSGKWDAGMSGALEWTPFQISEAEYGELVEELVTDPRRRFVIDADLAEVISVRKWQGMVLSKYGRRSRPRDG